MRDIYQRFSLVKMEHDAVCETHEELRADVDVAVRQLVMERAVLRGAVADLLARLEQSRLDRETDRETVRARERRSHQRRFRAATSPTAAGESRPEEREEEQEEQEEEEATLAKIRAQIGGADASDAVLLKAQLELQAIDDAQDEDDEESGYRLDAEGEEEMAQGERGLLHQQQVSAQTQASQLGNGDGSLQDGEEEDYGDDYEACDDDDGAGDVGDVSKSDEAAAVVSSRPRADEDADIAGADDDDVYAPLRGEGDGTLGAERKLFVSQIDDGCLYEGEGNHPWHVRSALHHLHLPPTATLHLHLLLSANPFDVLNIAGLNEIPDGYGAETYPDGSSYEGQFVGGQRSGLGVYYFTNGRIYEGEWSRGVREGTGVERYENIGTAAVPEMRKPLVVSYREGGLVMRKPLEGNKDVVSSLMMDVIDAVEVARAAAQEARAGGR